MIIPAIDLINGEIVRLYQGDYSKVTNYKITALEQLQKYANAGSQELHIVDLTGAKDPAKRQMTLLKTLLHSLDANVQVGGGIRTEEEIKALLEAGAKRVVIGSKAITDPFLVKTWMQTFGADKIVLALDVRIDKDNIGRVAISGWQENSTESINDVIERFLPDGLTHILCTDISKDGTLSGSNVALYKNLCEKYPSLQVQASGGIGELSDIEALKDTGVSGVIVGRALLEEKFTIEEALLCV